MKIRVLRGIRILEESCRAREGRALLYLFIKNRPKFVENGHDLQKVPNCMELQDLIPQLQKLLNCVLICNYIISEGPICSFPYFNSSVVWDTNFNVCS